MAYFVSRDEGMWELRESNMTSAGPRSRTLATFKMLSPEIIKHARSRATKELNPDELCKAAIRAGVPVALSPPDKAASDLLGEIRVGRQPSPVLKRLLVEALSGKDAGISDSVRAASIWIGATPDKRAETLNDLLLLADKLPSIKRKKQPFPRITSINN